MPLCDLSGDVDFSILERMTGGQDEITLEILELFVQQAAMWAPMLTLSHEGWRDALHTLRGAGAGLGASRLARLCAEVEVQEMALAAAGLERVLTALDQALTDIATYRHVLLLRGLRG